MKTRYWIAHLPVLILAVNLLSAKDWPQWQGPERDGVWPESDVVAKFPNEGPKIKWRTPVGLGYSGPAVVGKHVFLLDYKKKSGTVTVNPGGRSHLEGTEILRCFDAATGEEKWSSSWDQPLDLSFPNGSRTTPAVAEGKVVALGAEGRLVCCDATNGKKLWEHQLKELSTAKESPIWGYSSHPLIHEGRVYVNAGTTQGVTMAFSLSDGKLAWSALPCSEPGYAPPALIKVEGKLQIVTFFPKGVAGLDPAKGDVLWQAKIEAPYGMSIMQPAFNDGIVMVSAMGKKNLGIRLTGGKGEVAWDGVNRSFAAKNGSPMALGDCFVGCDTDGQLKCVKASTGELVWERADAILKKKGNSGTFFMARVADTPRFVVFNQDGELLLGEISTDPAKTWTESSRAVILKPTTPQMGNQTVVWSAPAFAQHCVFARNDEELICVSLEPAP
jgi:outer membrane protein assembly factor BamB